jgi:hypothetical protein
MQWTILYWRVRVIHLRGSPKSQRKMSRYFGLPSQEYCHATDTFW